MIQFARQPLQTWYAAYFVEKSGEKWIVSNDTAREIESALGRRFKPRWISFVDITGATVRVKRSGVELKRN